MEQQSIGFLYVQPKEVQIVFFEYPYSNLIQPIKCTELCISFNPIPTKWGGLIRPSTLLLAHPDLKT